MARKQTSKATPRTARGPQTATNVIPCLTEFYSAVAQKTIPPEFSKGFGLGTRGSVSAGFLPNGFAFPPAGAQARGIIVQSDATWGRGATIKVGFIDGTDSRKNQVRTIAPEWYKLSKADFKFEFDVPPNESDVQVTFQMDGFHSLVGKEAMHHSGEATLYLGFDGSESDDDIHRLVLHEFGHAIGFMHEHKHPASGIQWDWPRALPYYSKLFRGRLSYAQIREQLEALPNDGFRYKFSPFDPLSIMLYSTPEQAVVPGTWQPEFANINNKLSASDQAVACGAYGSTEIVTPTAMKIGEPKGGTIKKDGQLDAYTFDAPSADTYLITTEGDAIVHVDLTDANGQPTEPDDTGKDSISPQHGVFMLRQLDPGSYKLKVTASRFAPLTEGSYTIVVRHNT